MRSNVHDVMPPRVRRAEGRAINMSSAELDQFAEAFEHPERAAARRALGNR